MPTMKRKNVVLALIVIVGALAAVAWFEPTRIVRGYVAGETFFQGRPSSYWSKAIRNDDPKAHQETMATLKKGGDAVVPVLIVLLRDRTPPEEEAVEVRWRAAELLGDLGSASAAAAPALADALVEGDPHVRSVAAKALGQIGPAAKAAVPKLNTILNSKLTNSSGRIEALQALARMGAEARPVHETLVSLLKDQDEHVRWLAAKVLGKIGPPAAAAMPALIAALKDEDDEVREHAAEALGDIGPSAPQAAAAVIALTAVLKDPKANVRRDAVRSLGQMGPAARSAAPEVKKLTSDPDALVKQAAEKSLRQIETVPDGSAAKPR
jgi:HEAT repeat protein